MSTSQPPSCTDDGRFDSEPLTTARIAQIAKGLSHPSRIRILEQFAECQPHMTQDIVDGCTLAQSTISEHLRILREAGLVIATRDGPRTWYCLRRSVLRQFAAAAKEMADRSELIEA